MPPSRPRGRHAPLAALALLGGCASADPCATAPGQGGFIGGLASITTGSGERCVQQMQTAATSAEAREQQERNRAREQTIAANRSGAQLRSAEARMQTLRGDINRQRATVAQLRGARGVEATTGIQAQADALERDRAAAGRSPGTADVERLERRSRELEDALKRFGAI